jgi:GNAT superfamily N-acetyltransferase
MLPAIERAAAAQFRETPYPHLADAPLASEQIDLATDRVWVAEVNDILVAFAIVRMHDAVAHIQEIDVAPKYARQGIGAALIKALCAWAQDQGIAFVTLTTFDNVPWNAPYYSRLGFRLLTPNEWTAALLAVRRLEAQSGLDMRHRICMRMAIAPKTSPR